MSAEGMLDDPCIFAGSCKGPQHTETSWHMLRLEGEVDSKKALRKAVKACQACKPEMLKPATCSLPGREEASPSAEAFRAAGGPWSFSSVGAEQTPECGEENFVLRGAVELREDMRKDSPRCCH